MRGRWSWRVRAAWAACALVVAGCAAPMEYTPDYAAAQRAPMAPASQAALGLRGSYHRVKPGETLWRIAHSYGLDVNTLVAANRIPSARQLKVGQQLFIPLPPPTNKFLWPLQGTAASSISGGIDILAGPGSLVRASQTGRVAVATPRLSGWGKTVLLDHMNGYLTVYAGLDHILVAPGALVQQGVPIGSLGMRALHFQIRQGARPKSTIALLPQR